MSYQGYGIGARFDLGGVTPRGERRASPWAIRTTAAAWLARAAKRAGERGAHSIPCTTRAASRLLEVCDAAPDWLSREVERARLAGALSILIPVSAAEALADALLEGL